MRWRTSAGMLRAKVVACGIGAMVAVGGGASTAMAAVSLPDGRAFELVSPATNKNGADIQPDTQRTRAAADGNAVEFPSLTAFGDAAGTGVAVDYVSQRSTSANPGTNGWSTHAITPVQAPLSINAVLNADPLYVGDLSADLRYGVFRAWSPLTDNANVARASNLYVRDDLRTPGAGTYRLVSPCPLCDATSTPLSPITDTSVLPYFAGASRDFRHVVFESTLNLTTDVSGFGQRAYEWSDGQLRYLAYVPADPSTDITCGGGGPVCVPASWSIPGRGLGSFGGVTRPVNVISADGSRVFFTVPDPFTRSGRIYMRTAGTTTDELTASERTDCAGDPTCGGNGRPDPAPESFQSASFLAATSDGLRIFFSTQTALTDEDPTQGAGLYMYDASKPASDPHNLTLINVDREPGTVFDRNLGRDVDTDTSNSVQGVVATSADGSYVYFVTTGQLVAGQPLLIGDIGLYVWHDGTIRYIGRVNPGDLADLMTTGGNYQFDQPQSRVTPDGRILLFSVHDGSGFSLRYDHGSCTSSGNGCRELYVYDADTARLECASCKPDGTTASTDASTGLRIPSAASTSWHINHALSDDGTRAYFSTAESLLPQDTNGKSDVYQYDVPTGQLHLITSGTEPSDAYFMDAGADGRDVFFTTRERLVGWDTDTSYDMYDARVGGGFPEPTPAPPGCAGAACQGPPPAAPAVPQGGSDSFDGNGDLPAVLKKHAKSVRCKRGFVKRRVRGKSKCVKRRTHRAAKRRATRHHRRAK
jgi:hypothetical protein